MTSFMLCIFYQNIKKPKQKKNKQNQMNNNNKEYPWLLCGESVVGEREQM